MELSFRDDFQDVLVDWLTHERRAATGQADLRLEVLAAPHGNSPFLTLAEWLERSRDGLPWRVLKLLAVPGGDPGEPFWRDVLDLERDRWREELRRRLDPGDRVGALGLPLSVSGQSPEALVTLAELGPLRRGDLFTEPAVESAVRFPYLLRPYVAWPRLGDMGFSADQLHERWEIYCEENEVAPHLHEPLFPHFCEEALMGGPHGLILTSGWRLEVFG